MPGQQEQLNEEHQLEIIDHSIKSQSSANTSLSSNRSTPLVFHVKCGDSYYVSYCKDELIPSIVKALSWSLANTVIFLVIRSFASIADLIKSIIACILVLQILLYLLLAFLDAGTLLDNEAESPNEDRIFCVKCSLFRLERSKHCNFCNRCVGRYDHHCGVLKKCIGRRNIHIFTLWVLLLATELPFMVVLCFLELLSS